MKNPSFNYHRSATVTEALALLAEHGDDAGNHIHRPTAVDAALLGVKREGDAYGVEAQ